MNEIKYDFVIYMTLNQTKQIGKVGRGQREPMLTMHALQTFNLSMEISIGISFKRLPQSISQYSAYLMAP